MVATETIEAGADIDQDALVTETTRTPCPDPARIAVDAGHELLAVQRHSTGLLPPSPPSAPDRPERRRPAAAEADARGLELALLRLNLDMSRALHVSSEWTVGVAAWIVQDGNYGDFAVGDLAEFALEFYSEEGLAPADVITKHQAVQVAEDLYEITATVVHVDQRGWVLDFGLLAYRDTAPPGGVAVGQVLAGRITLGVDPFSYFERLAKDPQYPDMIYTWKLRTIGRETAPFVRRGNVWIRDESMRSRVDVPATNAWTDDGGNGDYVLRCDLLPVPPKRTSVSAR